LFPATAFWWLDHYEEFRRHLDRRYQVVERRRDVCVIYSLREPPESKQQQYQDLINRIRDVVRTTLPPGATVLVVSKGDDELVRLEGRAGWHFPQDEQGVYAGYNPADSAAAVRHLEELRGRGAQYLLIPQTALWWLDHYAGFRQHLEDRYRRLRSD